MILGYIVTKMLLDVTLKILLMIYYLKVFLIAIVITITIITWSFASKHAQHSVAVVSNNLCGEWLTYAKASTRSVLEGNNASATHLANLMVSSILKGSLSSYSA